MKFNKEIEEHEKRIKKILEMGGAQKLKKRSEEGVMNARERIDYLLDPDTFTESGLFAKSSNPDHADQTPADGKVSGFGKINNRRIGVVSNDFTVKGASSSPVNGKKIKHIKEVSAKNGFPIVFLGESSGGRMPDNMGAQGVGAGAGPNQYLRKREAPWVSAVLGQSFGSPTWYTMMADFSVMRKGATMAVASPKLVSLATGAAIDSEELGGWRLHTEVTGLVDVAVDTDEEALDAIKKYLSYLPSHHNEQPPEKPVPAGSEEKVEDILKLLPESQRQVYDMRRIIQSIIDNDSYFELKERFGKTMITTFARIHGKSVGIIANNPLYKGGAIDADAADKVTSFLVQCDSFNIPIILLVDQPGFLIGMEAEKKRMPGKIINWMQALSLCTVPKFTIILRKDYGQAVLNMGAFGNSDEVAAWWTAEISFMDPYAGVSVVYGVNPKDDPATFDQYLKEMKQDTTAYDMAANFGAQDVIDPRETRSYLKEMLDIYTMDMNKGIGQHLMATWPTTF